MTGRAVSRGMSAGKSDQLEDRRRGSSTGNFGRAWRRFRANKLAVAALCALGLLVAMALGASLISAHITGVTPSEQRLVDRFAPASSSNWLGTDEFGRDVLTRIAYGARVSLGIAFLATAVALVVGTSVGALSAYYGGWVDMVLMRLVDVMLNIPFLFLLILMSALFRVGPLSLALIIALLGWFGLSRLVRSEILSIRQREYVEAARVVGASDPAILLRHILPNATHIMIVWAMNAVPSLILAEAALSFLGLGIQPPTPSWGNMLTNSTQYLYQSKSLIFIPALFIIMTVLSLSIIGYALRDALDPRLNE